jgi:CRP-like cAMP-binding protein
MAITADTLRAMRPSPFLDGFSDPNLEALASSLEEAEFPRDGRLFEQGSKGDSMYLIISGQVGVVRSVDQDQEDGPAKSRDRMLAAVGPGELVGEMALIEGEPRSATVVALEKVVAARLTTACYEEMQKRNTKLALQLSLGLFRVISHRIRQVDRSLEVANYRILTT